MREPVKGAMLTILFQGSLEPIKKQQGSTSPAGNKGLKTMGYGKDTNANIHQK